MKSYVSSALLALLAMEATNVDAMIPNKSFMSEVMFPLKLESHKRGAAAGDYADTTVRIKEALIDGPAICTNGMINDHFPCNNMDVMSFLDGVELGSTYASRSAEDALLYPTWVSDIWGWTDPETGKEYALVSMWDGTSIVDISDPENPWAVMFVETTGGIIDGLEGYNPIWRDIKVYENTMYAGAEISFHGILTFDLTRVRDMYSSKSTKGAKRGRRELETNVAKLSKKSSKMEYSPYGVPIVSPTYVTPELGSTHNVIVFPEGGKLIAVGMEGNDKTCPGSYVGTEWERRATMAIFDISEDPNHPVFEECVYSVGGDRGYVHDAHCVIYHGPVSAYHGVPICALFMESEILLLNMEDMSRINLWGYAKAAYVHQGWFSDDHTVLYSDDELDEEYETSGTEYSTCYIWDITNLDGDIPAAVEFITPSDHPSIDHNLYIKDGYIYQAAYTSGARVRKIMDDNSIEEVAFFDGEDICECVVPPPHGDCMCDMWTGTWTFFPYYESGMTIAGNIAQGLFVLKPNL